MLVATYPTGPNRLTGRSDRDAGRPMRSVHGTGGSCSGDFDVQLPPGGQVGADWGVDASFQRVANNLIHDTDVKVVGPGSGDRSEGFRCRGSAANPLAPRGKVCVYLIGSGNAVDIRGVTPVAGSGGSRFGFKLIWDTSGNGDTFVDAVWAYHFS
jgi:hypothetical protein